MKNWILFFFIASSAHAAPLASLPGYDWEIIPTNPVCATVAQKAGAVDRQGQTLLNYPQNAWCKKSDLTTNLERTDTPDYRLLQWISQDDVTHIRMAYLSFSNKRVAQALCQALRRGVKVDLVLDSGKSSPLTDELEACQADNFNYYPRGNVPGIGFAHNKVTLITRKENANTQIVISSGNLTSGTVLLHENWHFVSVPTASHFT